jgi:hypothetical protein
VTSAPRDDAAYLNRSFKLEEDRLGNEDLASLSAEIADLCLEQLDLLAGTASSNLEETVDYGVEIDLMLVRHFLFILSCPRVGPQIPRGGVVRLGAAAGRPDSDVDTDEKKKNSIDNSTLPIRCTCQNWGGRSG